jgi:hypothetical protein
MDGNIDIAWQVANEMNIRDYAPEHSKDGFSFESIGSIPALANNGGTASYRHTDAWPYSENNFYRVKANSLDGGVEYSKIIQVKPAGIEPSICVYPNPCPGNIIQVLFTGTYDGIYDLQVQNNIGQVLYKQTIKLDGVNGSYNFILKPMAALAPGIYYLKILKGLYREDVIRFVVN